MTAAMPANANAIPMNWRMKMGRRKTIASKLNETIGPNASTKAALVADVLAKPAANKICCPYTRKKAATTSSNHSRDFQCVSERPHCQAMTAITTAAMTILMAATKRMSRVSVSPLTAERLTPQTIMVMKSAK
jgi:hypothetical protein